MVCSAGSEGSADTQSNYICSVSHLVVSTRWLHIEVASRHLFFGAQASLPMKNRASSSPLALLLIVDSGVGMAIPLPPLTPSPGLLLAFAADSFTRERSARSDVPCLHRIEDSSLEMGDRAVGNKDQVRFERTLAALGKREHGGVHRQDAGLEPVAPRAETIFDAPHIEEHVPLALTQMSWARVKLSSLLHSMPSKNPQWIFSQGPYVWLFAAAW